MAKKKKGYRKSGMEKFLDGLSMTLTAIGGLNWGIVGFGNIFNKDWNLVSMLVGKWAWVENLVYVLVGLGAVYLIVMWLGKVMKKMVG